MKYFSLQEGVAQQFVPQDFVHIILSHEIGNVKYSSSETAQIQTITKVGVVSDGERQLRVQPKVPVRSLLYMMGFSDRAVRFDNENVQSDALDELVEAMAKLYLIEVANVVQRGLVRRYREQEVDENALRGRLDFNKLVTVRSGIPLPVPQKIQEYDIDCQENRYLLFALEKLLSIPGLASSTRFEVAQAARAFAGVEPVRGEAALMFPASDRSTKHYDSAFNLARVILEDMSVIGQDGGTSSVGFLIDMWKIFEDFLKRSFDIRAKRAIRLTFQNQKNFFDVQKKLALRPDFLWTGPRGYSAVADAKYKRVSSSSPDNQDVYQMFAYCSRFELREGFIIYAQPYSGAFDIENAGVTIKIRGVDLSLEVSDLDDAVDQLFFEIMNTVSGDLDTAKILMAP